MIIYSEVLRRLESIEHDIRIKISETTGEIQREARLDHGALLFAMELVQEGQDNE